MISAKDQPCFVESLARGNIRNAAPKILGQHARVTSQMIHLVRGGLNQEVRLIFKRLVNGCFKHPGMRGADGVDSPGRTLAPRLS
jgi:hypothetical protein